MEYEKYYKVELDGNFTIHFRNANKFSIDRIKEIFAAHGDVIAVNSTKEIDGLRFIKFKKLEDIYRCIEVFQKSDILRILPQRRYNNKKYSKFSPLSHTSNQNIKQFNDNIHDYNNDSSSDTWSQGSRNKYRLNRNDDVEVMRGFHTDNHVNKNIRGYNKMPALISESDIQDKRFESLSDHSSGNVSKTKIVPMQEVIVANIHANYGVNYILHLFEKYNPIAATLIKKIPDNSIRYCHVYFKTPQDAIAVEKKFDNFCLSKNNLIVLRESRLIEIATQY